MAYTVDFTNTGKSPISVSNSNVDTSTSIGLVGQGLNNYGEIIAENMLHMLENFASTTAPTKPVEGQIWFDSTAKVLYYFNDTVANGGVWKPLATMSPNTSTPPTDPQTGDFWLNIDTGDLHIYYNNTWVSISNASGTTRVVTRQRYDISDTLHETLEFLVNGEIVSVMSGDITPWQPQNSGGNQEFLEDGATLLNTQFDTINPGQNMNQTAGYLFSGVALEALYADVAERYHADAEYVYGTVVKIGGSKEITQTTQENDSDVFGVVSENPAVRMNSGAGPDSTHPYIALTGRIPTRVVGRVSKGQRLVTSNVAGHAMASATPNPPYAAVVGRAIEDKINDDPGVIEVVVGVK